jgi:uncharacterized protein YggE
MNPIRTLSTIAVLAAATVAGTSQAAAAGARTITVSGTGIVTTVPNQAQFSFGASTTAPTARAALTGNAARMTRLVAALKGAGISSRDIQTEEVSLTPNTNDTGSKVLSFTASNSVTVTTRAISKSGSIVDAAVAAGANEVSGPSLGPADQLALQRSALKAAVADARARALAIAQAAHVKLGSVITVSENTSGPITYAPTPKAAAAAPNATTPIEPGTVQTEEDITVTFAIG